MSWSRFVASRDRRAEGGFTLVELVVVMLITSFVFAALAGMLGGSLRALSIAKTRAQANEVATQGIEDLQRFDFNDLGVCAGTADPAPTVPANLAGLTSVQLANCASTSLVYWQPCTPPSVTLTTFPVPKQSYTCVKNSITYTVNRFVMWSDASHTGKRLAVYVNWRDVVGGHQVAQESSLRSPNGASVIGDAPPQFVLVTVTAPSPVTVQSDGTLQSSMTFTASTSGLSATDRVFVTLDVLTTQPDGSTAALPSQFSLVSGDGVNWSASLSGSNNLRFGAGSQYVMFTEVRTSGDGKANSRVASNTLQFCPSSGCPNNVPSITAATVSPTSIDIDSSGALQSTFTVSVTTANLVTDGSVSMTLQTQTGAASVALQPSSSCVAGGTCASWSGTFGAGSLSFRLMPGGQKFYIMAVLPVSGSGGTNGSSAVAQTNSVTFA